MYCQGYIICSVLLERPNTLTITSFVFQINVVYGIDDRIQKDKGTLVVNH